MIEKFKCAIINEDVDGCEGCEKHPECLSFGEATKKLNDQLVEGYEKP